MTETELAQLRAILDYEVSSARLQLDAASRELVSPFAHRNETRPIIHAGTDRKSTLKEKANQ
jgi:hypothetical protein